MPQDRIRITEPNGTQRTRPLTERGLTIGRGTENDLVIAYSDVSRCHARIRFEGGRYQVSDLGSANGTYLGDVHLEPQVPTPWLFGQTLHIGRVSIDLLQATALSGEDASGRTLIWSPDQARPATVKRSRFRMWIAIAAAALVVLILAAVLLWMRLI